MIILIAGASHTGKTLLAQKLLEKYKFPYLSLDHLKMGLIRSGQTALSVNDDKKLTIYLWNITKELIKTAIENKQNLIIEGVYIPFDWKKDFDKTYQSQIKYVCLIMTRQYIEKYFDAIMKFENVIEQRLCSNDIEKQRLIEENLSNLQACRTYNCDYILIDKTYPVDIAI